MNLDRVSFEHLHIPCSRPCLFSPRILSVANPGRVDPQKGCTLFGKIIRLIRRAVDFSGHISAAQGNSPTTNPRFLRFPVANPTSLGPSSVFGEQLPARAIFSCICQNN